MRANMNWAISRGSGLIQLDKLVPLDALYPEAHGSGGIGALWGRHHKAFAHFLHCWSPSAVFEIGGAHGILAREFNSLKRIPWTIIEPNPSAVEGCEARYIKGFFDDTFRMHEDFDTVVHSHVFEHIYKPDEFMRHLSGFMSAGKKLVFSLPNMQAMLERNYTNCINFEHTVFLTEPYVEFLLARHGFKLLAKEYFMDDHSIFYAAVRDTQVTPIPLAKGLYEKNKKLYMDYLRYHRLLIADLNSKMSETNQPVYLFGAHVFAQYLIEMGLETKKIVSLLDNDSKKHGKRLYGTRLTVASPKVLGDIGAPTVILKAGVYNQEIKEDILSNINQSVTFLE
jgi:SAM-dependent methyltransferase